MKNFFPNIPKEYSEVWPTGKGEKPTELDNQVRKEMVSDTKEKAIQEEYLKTIYNIKLIYDFDFLASEQKILLDIIRDIERENQNPNQSEDNLSFTFPETIIRYFKEMYAINLYDKSVNSEMGFREAFEFAKLHKKEGLDDPNNLKLFLQKSIIKELENRFGHIDDKQVISVEVDFYIDSIIKKELSVFQAIDKVINNYKKYNYPKK